MTRPVSGSLQLAVLAALFAAACGASNDPIVIRIGDRAIPKSEFERRFWEYCQTDSSAVRDTAHVRIFAEKTVDDALLARVAEREVPTLEPVRQERVDEYAEHLWIEELHREAYGEAGKVASGELKAAYEKLGRRLKLRVLAVATEGEANEIRSAVQQGATFSKVAQQRSMDLGSRDAGGDIGWTSYLDLDPMTRDQVFSLPAGGISRPIAWGGYWQLFQAEEAQPNDARGALEEEKARLIPGIQTLKLRQAQEKYRADLLAKYHFRIDPAELAWLTVLLRERTATVDRGEGLSPDDTERIERLRTGSLPWHGNPVAVADTGRVIAEYDPPHGRITPLIVVDQLMTHPMPTWPKFDRGQDVETLIREYALEQLEVREAKARHMETRPAVIEAMADRLRDVRTRQYLRNTVRPTLRPSEEELRGYYRTHMSSFSTPEKRRFVAVNFADRNRALAARQLILQGKTPEELATTLAAADTSFKTTGSGGTPALSYGSSPLLDDVLFKLPLNAVSEPIPVGNSWTVAKVVEIEPYQETSFEEARTTIQVKVVEQRLPATVKEIVAKERAQVDVRIDRSALRTVRLRPES